MVEHSKPFIGINTDYRKQKKDSPAFSFVRAGYFDAVMRSGGIPLLLPPCLDEHDIDDVLDSLDGVIMIGGADLDPRNDGYMLHPSVSLLDERREMFDRALIKKVVERRLPFFGIGTGMQLLNVVLGGTLHLHIPEDLPHALPHRDFMEPFHRHELKVVKGSLLDSVYGDNLISVNSMHHMAIEEVAPCFYASAHCPDGVIEAIESTSDDWIAFGTQFHPESPSATALDRRIFHEFIQKIVENSKDDCWMQNTNVETIRSAA